MPKYLFTSDQRISQLIEKIQWVADLGKKGIETGQLEDKSENNNATTLRFYYNLYPGTDLCDKAYENPKFAIRNFVKKFQFPNTRTIESFKDSMVENTLFAPLRMVVTLLFIMSKEKKCDSYLTMDEILYFLFCDKAVYSNPEINYDLLISRIQESRNLQQDLSEKIKNILEWNQYARQIKEMITVLKYAASCFQIREGKINLLYENLNENDNEAFILEVVNYNLLWYPSDSNNFQLANKEYISYMDTFNTPYNVIKFNLKKDKPIKNKDLPLQQIYYGAPGTGKSHEIKKMTSEAKDNTIRTTFHPDTDYASFVGAYKPTTVEETVMTVIGTKAVPVENADGTPRTETKIIYEFVSQSFLKAYVKAWKHYAHASTMDEVERQYLIIEEINRGNCAQIFGDLFQLLDRNKYGFSDYPIEADADMQKQLQKQFDGLYIPLRDSINVLCDDEGRDIVSEVLNGKILFLPNNLYIWATMNTSDQSLFPIDSAFKRRWDWKYMKIENANKGWKINFSPKENDSEVVSIDWWVFIQKINRIIADMTSSADKQLGYFFCKADEIDNENPAENQEATIISKEKFVGKVLFYLWNDVFKDYGYDDADLFTFEDNGTERVITFPDFYNDDNEVNNAVVMAFINNVLKWNKDGNKA